MVIRDIAVFAPIPDLYQSPVSGKVSGKYSSTSIRQMK